VDEPPDLADQGLRRCDLARRKARHAGARTGSMPGGGGLDRLRYARPSCQRCPPSSVLWLLATCVGVVHGEIAGSGGGARLADLAKGNLDMREASTSRSRDLRRAAASVLRYPLHEDAAFRR
jgi:hypothetical protein